MHLTRAEASKRLPIPRKGTKYLARASNYSSLGVPLVIAIRDILGLAKTSREVKEMIKQKAIKLNGKIIKDVKEGIKLFNILEADKKYRLNILPIKKYNFEEGNWDHRSCKVIGKKLLKNNKIQLNMHDGTNILTEEKIGMGDSVELDFSGKIKKVIKLEKGKKGFVISGKSMGKHGFIENVSESKVIIRMEDKTAELEKKHVFVI